MSRLLYQLSYAAETTPRKNTKKERCLSTESRTLGSECIALASIALDQIMLFSVHAQARIPKVHIQVCALRFHIIDPARPSLQSFEG